MNPKTKKLIASCSISLPLLASSVLCPILTVKQVSAEAGSIENVNGVATMNSYFGAQGLRVFAIDDDQETQYSYDMPFMPWVPVFVESADNGTQDGSLLLQYEDISSSSWLRYSCYYDTPTFDDDNGVIDNGVTWCTPMYEFNTENMFSSIGLRYDGIWICDVYRFDNLPMDFYVDGGGSTQPPPATDINFSVLLEDGSWFDVSFRSREMSFFIGSHLPDNAMSIGGFYCIRDYEYTTYSRNTNMLELQGWGDPYAFIDGETPPDITEFLPVVINQPPVNVGDVIWQPVESFLNTQFIPDFTFGDLCLIALGISAFFMFLKIWMGG